MKKLYFLLVSCMLSCSALAVSPEAEFAKQFVDDMLHGKTHTEYISRRFMQAHGLTASTIQLDGYNHGDIAQTEIISDKPPFIVIEMTSKQYGWGNAMTFKVLNEDGQLAIVPSVGPPGKPSINPWVEDVKTMWDHKRLSKAEQIKAAEQEKAYWKRAGEEKASKASADLSWRKALREGDETNCGPVIEVKKTMVKIYFPVQNYGNEHWIRIDKIKPPGSGCRFINGQYVDS